MRITAEIRRYVGLEMDGWDDLEKSDWFSMGWRCERWQDINSFSIREVKNRPILERECGTDVQEERSYVLF